MVSNIADLKPAPVSSGPIAHSEDDENLDPASEPIFEEDDDEKSLGPPEPLEIEENDQGQKILKGLDCEMTIESKAIGEGAFCKVYRAQGFYEDEEPESQRVPYAFKVFKKSQLPKFAVQSGSDNLGMMSGIDKLKKEELKLWGKIRHPNIVTAFALFEDPQIDKMYLWMQLADLGSVSVYNEAE